MEQRHSLHLFWIEKGQSTLAYLAAGIGLIVLFGFRLRSLVPGFTAVEIATRTGSRSLQQILDNPIDAPYKLLQYGLQSVGHHGPVAMRGVSAVFACLAVVLFFYILRAWYTFRIAMIGTVLFACSSWLLQVGRLATPMVAQTMILAFIAYGTWLKRTRKPGLALIGGSILAGLSLYIPGFVWLVIFGGIWQHKQLLGLARKAPVWASISGLIFLCMVLPLGYAVSRQTTLLYGISSIPALNFHTLTELLKGIKEVTLALLWRGPQKPELWLIGTPMLDIFTLVMVILGTYYYGLRLGLDRTKLLAGCAIIGVLLAALGGSVTLAYIWPIIYLLAVSGIALMLQQWQKVFPKNPLAKRVGTILVIATVGISCYYHLSRYFIAWPQAPATKAAFHIPVDK